MLTSENSIERNFNDRDDDCELNQILDQGEHVCSNKFDLTLSCADDLWNVIASFSLLEISPKI